MFPKINPTTTKAWQQLEQHFNKVKAINMLDLFAQNPSRKEQYTFTDGDVQLDFSKNRVTQQTLDLLLQLAEQVQLKQAIEAQFSGEIINETEGRAVLHTALRDFTSMKPEVADTLHQMKHFSEGIISGTHKGYTGKAITDVVNIGIGGSDLGPAMLNDALTFYKNHLKTHFISNVDGDHVMEILKKVNPETTLFIVVSKTFTTQETLTNANTVRNWFLQNASEKDIKHHFAAVSTNLTAIEKFGIASNNVFTMWDWVGGRFSLWSAVGLSICLSVGYSHFEALLKGAHAMDSHFKNKPFDQNMPVMMALLSVWYNNFFKAETEAVLPYSQYLSKFVPYLQQAIMESNGKSVDRNGDFVTYQTGTIVWGSTGTNAQHAFFQLIHQGTKLIPSDFICFTNSLYGNVDHQDKLLANCYAQTDALLQGTQGNSVKNNYKVFEGNKPTNLIEISSLTPENLGKLIALYEHKLFTQGVIWNIFSYDQPGVELGKKMATERLEA